MNPEMQPQQAMYAPQQQPQPQMMYAPQQPMMYAPQQPMMYPQPTMYAPPPPQPSINVTVQQQQSGGGGGGNEGYSLGREPMNITCPSCSKRVFTKVDYKIGCYACYNVGKCALWGLLFPLLWVGFFLTPLCQRKYKDAQHNCPNCGHLIGTYTAM